MYKMVHLLHKIFDVIEFVFLLIFWILSYKFLELVKKIYIFIYIRRNILFVSNVYINQLIILHPQPSQASEYNKYFPKLQHKIVQGIVKYYSSYIKMTYKNSQSQVSIACLSDLCCNSLWLRANFFPGNTRHYLLCVDTILILNSKVQ